MAKETYQVLLLIFLVSGLCSHRLVNTRLVDGGNAHVDDVSIQQAAQHVLLRHDQKNASVHSGSSRLLVTQTHAQSLLHTGVLATDFALVLIACCLMFPKWKSIGLEFDIGLNTNRLVQIFFVYVAFSTGHMFLQQQAGKTGYSFLAATVMVYFGKCLVSLLMFLWKGNVAVGFGSLFAPGCTRLGKVPGFLLPLIPGGLFAGYDALSFFGLQSVDPATYQVLVRMRIVFVGVLWQVMFQRKLSGIQWLAFLLIFFAGLTKGIGHVAMDSVHFNLNGIWIMLIMNWMSAFGSVCAEALLKEMPMPIDLINTCTYFWGMMFLCLALLTFEGPDALYSELLSPAAWTKLRADPWMISAICCLTAFGIVTAYLLKELSNITKELAGGVVIFLSAVLPCIFFGEVMTTLTAVGSSMAVLGLKVYSTPKGDA
eukprot:TRINITY_DN4364_c0_g9_i1.p1 TRINITY_DN4364_c0_g9~~TRINITY_DN4364_c0_g9_i1.p1  ORF type:complete len:427 (-),score=40.38 TRINITY_DN4364_c0_g9_i1:58-1338(-)